MPKKILGYLELALCFVNKMAVGGGGRPCLKDCEKRVMEVSGRWRGKGEPGCIPRNGEVACG